MTTENSIGLSELIQQVKKELLAAPLDDEGSVPFLGVDSIELELQVTVKRGLQGKIKIYVLELGGNGTRDDIQKVKVKLSPLLDKEQLLALYRKKYPDQFPGILEQAIRGGIKNPGDNTTPLGDRF